jgi:hypothetical protein
VPEIPTLASLGVIIGILVVVTLTSLAARRRQSLEASADDPRVTEHADASPHSPTDRESNPSLSRLGR